MCSLRQIALIGSGLAALAAAVAAAGGAAAQSGAGSVDTKLQRELQHLAAGGFARVGGESIERASKDEPSVVAVELESGVTYAVVAACGEGCDHVEIALFDPAQSLLTRSPEASDVVIVSGPAQQSGVHGIALSVPGCRAAACPAGFVLLRQAPPPGPPEAATPGAAAESPQMLAELAKLAVTAREAARARERRATAVAAPVATDTQSAPGRPSPSPKAARVPAATAERSPRTSGQGGAPQAGCQQVAQQYAAAVQSSGPPETMPELFRLYRYLQCNCGYPPSPQVPPCSR
jgi:hypothetical protein